MAAVRVYVFNAPPVPVRRARVVDPYCNLLELLIEGVFEWNAVVGCAYPNSYGVPVTPFAPDYSCYWVQRHPRLDGAAVYATLNAHGCLSRTAFIDGMDDRFGLDWFWRTGGAHYFRNANRPHYGARTLPFGILNRYVSGKPVRPDPVVFYVCNESSHPDRVRIRRKLERMPWNCEFGPLLDDDGPVVCSERRGHQRYLRRLNECRVAVNAPGGAPDCYRYWEIAASRAALVSHRVERQIHAFPDAPVAGVHYVPYDTIEGVGDAVAEAMDRYDELQAAQRAFFLTRHRGRNRAARVLSAVGITEASTDREECGAMSDVEITGGPT